MVAFNATAAALAGILIGFRDFQGNVLDLAFGGTLPGNPIITSVLSADNNNQIWTIVQTANGSSIQNVAGPWLSFSQADIGGNIAFASAASSTAPTLGFEFLASPDLLSLNIIETSSGVALTSWARNGGDTITPVTFAPLILGLPEQLWTVFDISQSSVFLSSRGVAPLTMLAA